MDNGIQVLVPDRNRIEVIGDAAWDPVRLCWMWPNRHLRLWDYIYNTVDTEAVKIPTPPPPK